MWFLIVIAVIQGIIAIIVYVCESSHSSTRPATRATATRRTTQRAQSRGGRRSRTGTPRARATAGSAVGMTAVVRQELEALHASITEHRQNPSTGERQRTGHEVATAPLGKRRKRQTVSPPNKFESLPDDLLAAKATASEQIVTVWGIGRAGSWGTYFLAPHGGVYLCFDPDVVELRNTLQGASLYGLDDVGTYKAVALRERIKRDYPNAKVLGYRMRVEELSDGDIEMLAQISDLFLIAVDDGAAIFRINRLAYSHVPCIYPGIHRRGVSGHLVVTIPGSPCLIEALGTNRPSDVRTLVGESVDGADVKRVVIEGVQIALDLLGVYGPGESRVMDYRWNVVRIENRISAAGPQGTGTFYRRPEKDPDCEVCGTF